MWWKEKNQKLLTKLCLRPFRTVVWFLGYVSLCCLSKSAHLPGQVEPALSRWLWRPGGFTSQVKLHYLIFPDNHSPAYTHASGYRLTAWDMLKSQKKAVCRCGNSQCWKKTVSKCLQHFIWVPAPSALLGLSAAPHSTSLDYESAGGMSCFDWFLFCPYTCFCNEATVHTGNPTCESREKQLWWQED